MEAETVVYNLELVCYNLTFFVLLVQQLKEEWRFSLKASESNR